MTDLSLELGWSRWRRSWWYHGALFARTWRGSLISAVTFPVLYLLAMGVGVGHLVSAHTGLVQGQTYVHFIAPSLLATTAMQTAEADSLYPTYASLKWFRTYHAAAATPLEPRDIFFGKVSWIVTRALATGVLYTLIIALFGAVHSWWGLALPFVCALVALAFSAPFVAFAARAASDAAFVVIYRLAVVPMFLFSATFYPVSAYPGYLRPVVQFVPLYHAVALARSCATGTGTLAATGGHLVVLTAMGAVGLVLGQRTMARRLVD